MNDMQWYQIIWGIGVLALAAGALAGYQLSWKKGLVYILIWGAIFAGVTLLMNAIAL